MKLWQCDWVPSSVADWLCRELDNKGILGTTYTHTLLSLVHPFFCPHPVLREPSHHLKKFINLEGVASVLNSEHLQELEILFDNLELEEHVHPDADFPEVNNFGQVKEGSKHSKKLQKRKPQKAFLSSEKVWKIAALQCLLTASDERENLESIVEELFHRLKTAGKSRVKETKYLEQLVKVVGSDPQQSGTDELATAVDVTKRLNFPPLLTLKEEVTQAIDDCSLNWKSLMKCTLDSSKEKYSCEAEQNATTTPLNQSSECIINNSRDADVKINSLICTAYKESKDKKVEMELSPSSLEDEALGNEAYCFLPILSDQSRQVVADTRHDDKEDQVFQLVKPNIVQEILHPKEGNLEELDCPGNALVAQANRALSVDLSGNRLYERYGGSTDIRCSSSNMDVAALINQNESNAQEMTNSQLVPSVWGYSTSWRELSFENVWNSSAPISQSFNETLSLPPQHITPFHSFATQECFEKSPVQQKELEMLQQNSFLSENWPENQSRNPFHSLNPKRDAIFSSAFRCSPHTAYREGTKHDCKSGLPEMSPKNYKNIWSDMNDNITAMNQMSGTHKNDIDAENSSVPTRFDPLKKVEDTDENLCKSFKQLGLEHLWEDPPLNKTADDDPVMLKSFGCESSSSIPFLNEPTRNQKDWMTISDELYRMKYAEYKEIGHAVLFPKIPCGPSGPYVDLRHTETSGFSAVVPHDKKNEMTENLVGVDGTAPGSPTGVAEALFDTCLSTQEDENLLTSPRTHFRPIRQDSHGSNDEGKSEDQAIMAMVGSVQDPDLVFRRSGSGTLYLESDLIKGSPKKYMAYREPSSNVPVPPTSGVGELQEYASVTHVSESPSTTFVPKFKLVNNEKFCQTEGPEASSSLRGTISKELESKILQKEMKKYDFLYNASDSNIKQIWEEHPPKKIEIGGRLTSHYPEWSSQDVSQVNWSTQSLQSSVDTEDIHNPHMGTRDQGGGDSIRKSEDDAFSKIKFIWYKSVEKDDASAGNTTKGNSASFNADFPLRVSSDAEVWDEQQLPKVVSHATCNEPSGSNIIPESPWGINVGLHEHENEYGSVGEHIDPTDLASRWQLQWEVDQEADEILGCLLPPSPLKASPPYETLQNSGTFADLDDLKFLDFLERRDQTQEQHQIEDLDHLEPGWDLNEGFEWGPASEELFEDKEGGQEVLVYENADGETVVLPVEYFEDSIYDQIFGSADTPIGGSMPDLPGGQLSDMKKSCLSYKLSRRSRGDKFVPPSRRPCSFFLEGNCRRSDCKFSHDLLTITCRFWEEGSCLKGDTCPFRHGFAPTTRRRNRSEGDQASLVEPVSFASLKEGNSGAAGGRGKTFSKKSRGSVASISSFELDSETDFPCLGSSVESKIGSLDEQHFPSNIKVTKVAKKKKKYITVTKSLFKEIDGDGEKGGGSGKRRKGHRVPPDASVDEEESLFRKKGKECDTLRKILRKRYPVPPQPPYSHEDGTVSDF